MKSSIRFASSGGNSAISWNDSTCRSGRTSRCVSAWGLMSRIATKPSVAATWSPSRIERAEEAVAFRRRAPPPRRPPRRARARGRRPARARRRATASSRRRSRDRDGRRARRRRGRSSSASVRGTPRATRRAAARRAPSSRRRHRVVERGHRAGPRRVREDVHLREARCAHGASVFANARSSSAGKPTITSLVRLNSSCSGASRRRYVAAV